ncbi:MAG: YqaJ viral recombinase family protein [Leptolyngbyaceae bacterium]|nr:YqaJ viral recombinase family protein [Leptolyngbyaceae bacterium]
MTVTYHNDIVQHTEEWLNLRLGLLTASEICRILTPAKLQYVTGEKEKAHLYEILAQRINGFAEPVFQSYDMFRGLEDEVEAKNYYRNNYDDIVDTGFITNDKWGFTLGYSPDGLVGDDGLVECKSRVAKYQIQTIIDNKMPDDYKIQVQAGLLISERKWCDFISYCNGMKMYVTRIYPDPEVQDAIVTAATTFHQRLDELAEVYSKRVLDKNIRLIQTEYKEKEVEIKAS